MRIKQVTLTVSDQAAAAAFFNNTLGLPVTRDLIPIVTVGTSQLLLKMGETDANRADHLALLVAADDFDRAKNWLREQVTLLRLDGSDEIALDAPWNSRSAYCRGPDGMLLEIIARNRLRRSGEEGAKLGALNISEVGVTVAPVAENAGAGQAAADLAAAFGLGNFGEGFPDFAPIGDDEGLLILVGSDRPWFLVHTRPAMTSLEVVIELPQHIGREVRIGRSLIMAVGDDELSA